MKMSPEKNQQAKLAYSCSAGALNRYKSIAGAENCPGHKRQLPSPTRHLGPAAISFIGWTRAQPQGNRIPEAYRSFDARFNILSEMRWRGQR